MKDSITNALYAKNSSGGSYPYAAGLRFDVKINKSTNVLSFPQNDERFITKKTSKIILGDIVISLEKVKTESQLQGIQFSDHLTHMVIHSLLHLLGFNHKKLKDFKIMKKKEINVLSKLSISSPYVIND